MNEVKKGGKEKEKPQDKKRWQAPSLKEIDVSDSAGVPTTCGGGSTDLGEGDPDRPDG